MFCPNCAAKNEDDVKYCRDCGQDISLVVRSLKGHSPLVLASKIDKVFDRRNEILLRDGFLFLTFGIGGISLFVWQIWSGNIPPVFVLIFEFVIISVHAFIGIFNLLAYWRGLSKTSKTPVADQLQDSFYCPVCGESNKSDIKSCSKCGKDLTGVVKVMTQQYGWIDSKLEEQEKWIIEGRPDVKPNVFGIDFVPLNFTVNWANNPAKRPILWALAGVSWISLAFLFFRGDTEFGVFYLTIILGFVYLTGGGWGFIVEKRLASVKDETVAEKRLVSSLKQAEANLDAETTKSLNKFILAIIITMSIIIMLLFAMTATFLWYIVVASSILGFTFVLFLLLASIIGLSKTVKFYKAYSEIRDGLQEEVSASPTSELQNENDLEAKTAELEAETQRQLSPIDAESEIDSATESVPTRELVDAQRTEIETKRLNREDEQKEE